MHKRKSARAGNAYNNSEFSISLAWDVDIDIGRTLPKPILNHLQEGNLFRKKIRLWKLSIENNRQFFRNPHSFYLSDEEIQQKNFLSSINWKKSGNFKIKIVIVSHFFNNFFPNQTLNVVGWCWPHTSSLWR